MVDLSKHLSEATELAVMKRISSKTILPASRLVEVESRVRTDTAVRSDSGGAAADGVMMMEDVSDLNGMAVPAYFEATFGRSTPRECAMQKRCKEYLTNGEEWRQKYAEDVNRAPESMTQKAFLRMAAICAYFETGFKSRVEQIGTKYDWLPRETFEKLLDTLDRALKKGGDFQYEAVAYEVS